MASNNTETDIVIRLHDLARTMANIDEAKLVRDAADKIALLRKDAEEPAPAPSEDLGGVAPVDNVVNFPLPDDPIFRAGSVALPCDVEDDEVRWS